MRDLREHVLARKRMQIQSIITACVDTAIQSGLLQMHESEGYWNGKTGHHFRGFSTMRSCRQQTKRPTEFQKCRRLTVPTRVESLFPPQAQRVPLRQPEHLRSHQKIDTHGSNDRACHRGCNSRFDEGNQVVDDRPVHNNGTCLSFRGSCRLCQNSCHCCSRDLTCQQISHVVCTSL